MALSNGSRPETPMLYTLTNWGLFLAGATNLVIGTWSALKGEVAVATTSLTAGFALLFAATIDRFESLKGLGLEAKTRKLDQKLEQADDALRRLRQLAELTGTSILELNSKIGRWSMAPSARESYALAQEVRKTLSGLGSDPQSVNEALRPWIQIFLFDLALAVCEPLRRALKEKSQVLDKERATIRQPIRAGDPLFASTTASIREITDYIDSKLDRMDELTAADYPENFLAQIEQAPQLDRESLAAILQKARSFVPMMLELRRDYQLANPAPWFEEVDRYRARKQ